MKWKRRVLRPSGDNQGEAGADDFSTQFQDKQEVKVREIDNKRHLKGDCREEREEKNNSGEVQSYYLKIFACGSRVKGTIRLLGSYLFPCYIILLQYILTE